MYPSKEMEKGGDVLVMHWAKGQAEYLSPEFGDGLVNFADTDHACNLHDSCSISASIHLMNGVFISWRCKKQPKTALHSTGAKICALHARVMKTKILCQFSASISFPKNVATPTMEDNQGTIKYILKSSHITDSVWHLYVQITWLAEQYDTGVVKLTYSKTEMVLADCATKLVPWSSLRK